MKYFFNKYHEFIDNDVRTGRMVSPIDAETFSNRHEVALPEDKIKGKTILDLGSCIGATGQWCLANNAAHYTGIEVQQNAIDKSNELLSNYWDDTRFDAICIDVNEFLDQCIAEGRTFDIVVAFGIIYGYVDYYSVLAKIAKVAKEGIVIDCRYPPLMKSNGSIIEFNECQHCHIDGEESLNFIGAGVKISPSALRTVMQTLQWDNNGTLIYPEEATEQTFDMYLTCLNRNYGIDLPTRYMTIFEKSDTKLRSVSENVANSDQNFLVEDKRKANIASKWKFDDSIAVKFKQEAEKHIPDYHKVIELSYNAIATAFPNKDTRIIDVGSAIGETVNHFIDRGYENTYGVEKSVNMIAQTLKPVHIIHSDVLPHDMKWDAVIANWTLHFVHAREQYLADIFDSLNPGGMLILSDKTKHTTQADESYYKFKRNNGVSEEEIQAKEKALKGVLVPLSLSWYLDTLRDLGFENIQVINARFMFYTIQAIK